MLWLEDVNQKYNRGSDDKAEPEKSTSGKNGTLEGRMMCKYIIHYIIYITIHCVCNLFYSNNYFISRRKRAFYNSLQAQKGLAQLIYNIVYKEHNPQVEVLFPLFTSVYFPSLQWFEELQLNNLICFSKASKTHTLKGCQAFSSRWEFNTPYEDMVFC